MLITFISKPYFLLQMDQIIKYPIQFIIINLFKVLNNNNMLSFINAAVYFFKQFDMLLQVIYSGIIFEVLTEILITNKWTAIWSGTSRFCIISDL